MAAIVLAYDRVIRELKAFAALFSYVHDPASQSADAIWRGLQLCRSSYPEGREFSWEIGDPHEAEPTRNQAIRTIVSKQSDEGREWPEAYAEFFMIWRLTQGARSKGKPAAEFSVRSASSICRVIRDSGQGREVLAQWNFDIADVKDEKIVPGCKLHVQTGKAIEIPRLPSLAVLPSDALAFLAAELFPKRWPTKLQGKPEARFFWSQQQTRVAELLQLWIGVVNRGPDPLAAITNLRNYDFAI